MLGAFHNGVLHWTAPASSGTWKVKSGSYIGNGTTQAITGLGFQPQFLIIKSTGSTANDDPVFAWSGMTTLAGITPAATVVNPAAAPVSNIITAYGADGFTLSSSTVANTNNTRYYWFALAGGDGEVALGNYAGTGVDDSNLISGLAFQPKLLFVKRRNLTTSSVAFRFQSIAGDPSYQVSAFAATANQIQALNSDGAQMGNNASVNVSPATYDWIAFNPPDTHAYFSAYTGSGADNYNALSGLTWQPELVFIKGNTNQLPVIRGTVHTGDTSTILQDSTANAANVVQAFNSDGFQVGTSNTVNSAATRYDYFVMRTT